MSLSMFVHINDSIHCEWHVYGIFIHFCELPIWSLCLFIRVKYIFKYECYFVLGLVGNVEGN